jgi:hypothetical protein
VKRSANRTVKIWIGTSGRTYDGWRGPFYPKETPKRLWLTYYSTQFHTTEINGSFYRTPAIDAVRNWRDSTPREFTFAWKASKFITHWKRLSEKCENSIALMETRLEALGTKGCLVLFQLPPNFSADQARLAAFIQMLPNTRRYTPSSFDIIVGSAKGHCRTGRIWTYVRDDRPFGGTETPQAFPTGRCIEPTDLRSDYCKAPSRLKSSWTFSLPDQGPEHAYKSSSDSRTDTMIDPSIPAAFE